MTAGRLLANTSLFVLLLAVPARADIDHLCLNNCVASGTPSGTCMNQCSYTFTPTPKSNDIDELSSHRILSAPTPLKKNKVHRTKPKKLSTTVDRACIGQCLQNRTTYGYCEKQCTRVDDGSLILH